MSEATQTSWINDKLFLGLTPRAYLRGLVTPFNAVVGLILAVGLPTLGYRLWNGIGATSNLSQVNPWGLWTGLKTALVALAGGGYTLACAVYIFGLKKYHAVARTAVLTGLIGYTFFVLVLLLDLGRPWKLPVPLVYSYGVTSVLFEVAWCVAFYATVLFLEFSPAVFEWLGWKKARAWVMRIMMGLIVLGVVLSTMHQSSLGSLFLMAPTKIHPLWYSSFIPIYFFISSMAAGLSMVIVTLSIARRAFRDRLDPSVDVDELTLGMSKAASLVLFSYFFARLLGVADGHAWHHLLTGWGAWYLVEMLGFVLLPCFLFAHAARTGSARLARVTAWITVVGMALNRFNISFITWRVDAPDRYTPAWAEVVISVTMVTLAIVIFRWIVNRMPVLRDHPEYSDGH